MNIFLKQMERNKGFTAALLLLLAFAVGFSCIGYAAWNGVNEQIEGIGAGYTTIAVPKPRDEDYIFHQMMKGYRYDEAGTFFWSDGTVTYTNETVAAVAEQAPQVFSIEKGGILSAGLKNLKGLASGSQNTEQYNQAFDRLNYGFCVLALKCTDVVDVSIKAHTEEIDGYTTKYAGMIVYDAYFEVEECISLMDSYGDITGRHLRIWGGESTHPFTEGGGKIPFEAGKTYLVRGFYRDIPIGWIEDPEMGVVLSLELDAMDIPGIKDISTEEHVIEEKADGHWLETYYYTAMEGALPYYAEYTGTAEEFLNSEDGKVWREVIIPWTKTCQNSATLILTDNLNSVYNFNTGAAVVMEGRAFTEEEYQKGSPVCLISAAFAKHNGLNLGDFVTADLYDTGVSEEKIHITERTRSYNDYIYVRKPITQETKIAENVSYEIIGIYSAPEFSDGQYNFTADSIFVPKNSVENPKQYEEPAVAYLNALVLKNGTQDEFEAYMEDMGMGGYYVYLDMNFEDTLPVLEAMKDNAFRLMLIAAALFVLVSGVGIYLMQNRMKAVVIGARRIGLSAFGVWKQSFCALVISEVLGIALGTALGTFAFNTVTQDIMKMGIAFEPKSVFLCAGIETAILIAASAVCCAFTSNPDLMQSLGGKKKRRR